MLAVALLAVGEQVCTFADEECWWLEPVRVGESKSVTKNGASFQVVAETEWVIGKHAGVPVDIRLRITNVSKRAMIFRTDMLVVMMKDPAGKKIWPAGGSNGPVHIRPILIPAGASYSIVRKGELRFDDKLKTHELWYWNDPKSVQIFGPLSAGQFKLSFYFHVSPPRERPGMMSKTNDAEEWVGDVRTNELTIKLLDR
jgi:hypothetical protein